MEGYGIYSSGSEGELWLPPQTEEASGSTMELFAASGLEQPSVDSQDCMQGILWWVVHSRCPCDAVAFDGVF